MTKHLLKHLRTKIFTGILVALPLGITFFVLRFVINTIDSILGPLLPAINISILHRRLLVPGLGMVAFFLLLYLTGVVTSNVLGRKLISLGDRLFAAIPVVKNIYTSSKQLTDAFSATRKGAFRQAVFVQFPLEGNFALGFITNELRDLQGQERVAVFIPTAFVPPMGFLLFLPKEKILPSNMTIEEAIKAIMSVGIVSPSKLSVALPGVSPKGNSLKDSLKDSIENFSGIKYLNSKREGGS